MGTVHEQNIDELNEEEDQTLKQIQPFKFYATNTAVTQKILETRWGQFTMILAVVYVYHLCWAMAGVNMFSNDTRNIVCGSVKGSGFEAAQKASAIFDTAIVLVTIFHMIDWIRWTLLLTAALVSVNLLPVFYFLTVINVPYGIIVCIIAIVTRFSSDGNDCAMEGKQPTRAFYLGLQIICLVIILPTSLLHIVYMRIRGVEWCHEQYVHEEEEEE
jgi:hypothetical protein